MSFGKVNGSNMGIYSDGYGATIYSEGAVTATGNDELMHIRVAVLHRSPRLAK